MKEKIVFVAGGTWQKPFVKYLKDKGHFVAVVNPVETATTTLADYHIKCDVNNIEEINSHIELLEPIFITSDQSDISTLAVAKLSERWGLPGNSVAVVERLTNKLEMFNFASSIGVPVPKTALVMDIDTIMDAGSHLGFGFPVIIKPVDSTMSRGFRKFDSFSEITQDALDASLRFSKSQRVIVQEFIPGYMVTLEGVCSGGKHKTIAVSKKDENYFKPGINSGVRYPSGLPADLVDKIVAANDRYVEEAGMRLGLTHAEYIINDKGFWLIEIGGRGGGAGITDKIVPWVSGVQVYDILYESLMGNVVDVKAIKPLARSALLKYYRAEDVEKCSEAMAEAIRAIPGVADFQYDFIGKQYVSDRNDTRHSMAIYLAETDDGVKRLADEIAAMVSPNTAA